MAKDIIRGAHPIEGVVSVDRAKNAVLPILAACLLSPGPSRLIDVPMIEDVDVLIRLMALLGAEVRREDHGFAVQAAKLETVRAPEYLTSRMRASFLLAGPLLARFGRAEIALPGGCAIGARPVDLHLRGFEAMGASIALMDGVIHLRAKDGLDGALIYLDYPSVGATENLMMAATLAHGTTTIVGAAMEPEVADLAAFLEVMGAEISGEGTSTLVIEGKTSLGGAAFTPIPDRIEAGTYLVAAAVTGGDVTVRGVQAAHLASLLYKLRETGSEIEVNEDRLRLKGPKRPRATDVKTYPYPGFPTDMQAPFMVLLAKGEGRSIITETVFESRYGHVEELCRMGARIRIEGRSAVVEGVDSLMGATVRATDLRGAAALTLAGLAAWGVSEVEDCEHLDRGYRNLESKLASLGADIERVAG